MIVSAGSAADWTVTIGGEENRRAILPALWIDIHGNVVEEFWQRTKGFLQKFLEERPGSTCVSSDLNPGFTGSDTDTELSVTNLCKS